MQIEKRTVRIEVLTAICVYRERNVGEKMKKMFNSSTETSWQDRFKKEYAELKERYEKLHKMLIKYEAGTLDFKPNCSIELLKKQAKAMGEYLYILEVRAEIENISL